MNAERHVANKRLRAAVDRVTAASNPKRRAEAAVALRQEVQREEARIRHECRRWALRVVEEGWPGVVNAARHGTDSALREALETVAVDAGDVGDERLGTFKPAAHDLTTVRTAIQRGVKALWGLSYLALRTGGLDQDATERPTAKEVTAARLALRKTPGLRADARVP
jgi:hypothetical protein